MARETNGDRWWSDEGMTRVALQERRTLLRTGVELLLEGEDDLTVVGTAETDTELREVVRRWPADVVVLEVRPEEWDVTALVDDIRRLTPNPEVLVVGLHAGRRSDHTAVAKEAGIDVFLPYSTGCAGLISAIRGVEPRQTMPPTVDRRVLPGREVLTPREQEVLKHISAGLTTQQSAQLLEVSPKTVDNHKQRMFAKLGVQNQAHAVAVAHRAGIIRPHHQEASGA